jgi:hypothetical protein
MSFENIVGTTRSRFHSQKMEIATLKNYSQVNPLQRQNLILSRINRWNVDDLTSIIWQKEIIYALKNRVY